MRRIHFLLIKLQLWLNILLFSARFKFSLTYSKTRLNWLHLCGFMQFMEEILKYLKFLKMKKLFQKTKPMKNVWLKHWNVITMTSFIILNQKKIQYSLMNYLKQKALIIITIHFFQMIIFLIRIIFTNFVNMIISSLLTNT